MSAPKRVYLQWGEELPGAPDPYLDEVTWSPDRQGPDDVEYVRASLERRVPDPDDDRWFDMHITVSVEASCQTEAEGIMLEVRKAVAEALPADAAWCCRASKVVEDDDA
jgi:hypothetical protein